MLNLYSYYKIMSEIISCKGLNETLHIAGNFSIGSLSHDVKNIIHNTLTTHDLLRKHNSIYINYITEIKNELSDVKKLISTQSILLNNLLEKNTNLEKRILNLSNVDTGKNNKNNKNNKNITDEILEYTLLGQITPTDELSNLISAHTDDIKHEYIHSPSVEPHSPETNIQSPSVEPQSPSAEPHSPETNIQSPSVEPHSPDNSPAEIIDCKKLSHVEHLFNINSNSSNKNSDSIEMTSDDDKSPPVFVDKLSPVFVEKDLQTDNKQTKFDKTNTIDKINMTNEINVDEIDISDVICENADINSDNSSTKIEELKLSSFSEEKTDTSSPILIPMDNINKNKELSPIKQSADAIKQSADAIKQSADTIKQSTDTIKQLIELPQIQTNDENTQFNDEDKNIQSNNENNKNNENIISYTENKPKKNIKSKSTKSKLIKTKKFRTRQDDE